MCCGSLLGIWPQELFRIYFIVEIVVFSVELLLAVKRKLTFSYKSSRHSWLNCESGNGSSGSLNLLGHWRLPLHLERWCGAEVPQKLLLNRTFWTRVLEFTFCWTSLSFMGPGSSLFCWRSALFRRKERLKPCRLAWRWVVLLALSSGFWQASLI